jgi:hypothetical protein
LSEYLSRKPPSDIPKIKVKMAPPQHRGPADQRVISDAHHRFVWSAQAGTQVMLTEPPGAVGAYGWGDVAYSPSENNEGVPRTLAITDDLREKYFERWVGLGHPMTADYKFDYAGFITDLASGLGEEGASYAKDLLEQKMRPEPRVLVVRKDPTSRGHWDASANLIVLQEATPLAMLDTLLFETGNARRKEAYTKLDKAKVEAAKKGYMKAEIEFGVDEDYINGLLRIYAADSLDALVEKFEINKKFLVKQDLSAVMEKPRAPYVDMPSKDELPMQSHRQALWFRKTSEWAVKDRRHIWVIENHTNLGMGASDKVYSSV